MTGVLVRRFLEALSIVLLVGLMVVTGLDVIGRYLLSQPLPGAFELTELMLGGLVFASLPLVSQSGGHVDVDVVTARLSPSAQHAIGLAMAAVSAAVLLFFAWRLWVLGGELLTHGGRSQSLHVPFAPFAYFGALACVLAAVLGLIEEARK